MDIAAIIFLILLLFNVPLAFAIGIGGIAFFMMTDGLPLGIATQSMVSATQSFPLLAVPFFVLAGNLMNAAGITERLIRFATVLTGHLKGGLAQVSVVLSALMGGISGSNNADAAMEARILGPSMTERGYSKGYSAAVIGLSSLITATIPPSIGLILYGFVGEVSIGKLFIAGIIPGCLMTLILMTTTSITAQRRNYAPVREQRANLKELLQSFKESIWALLFPVILVGGIRFGVFTPSEAGAFAVVYAFCIGKFVYKELDWTKFGGVLKQTVIDNGIIMMIIMAAAILGIGVVYDRVPQNVAGIIIGISNSKAVLLPIVLLFLFVAGMLMEATVNTLLLTPIFLPLVAQVGVDPVHFGILMMTIVTMGGMTPPVGVTLYTVCSLMECPPDEYVRESAPFVLAILLEVIILAVFPQVVLFLPNLIY
jgi:tripartite ATP-independent transporter DctM subunit